MWLLYLRFDDAGVTRTYHVTAENKKAADRLFDLAEQHGLTATSRLIEYAIFYTRGTVKPKQVPNFHFYSGSEFISKWEERFRPRGGFQCKRIEDTSFPGYSWLARTCHDA